MKLPDPETILGTPKAEAAFLGIAILYASMYRGWGTFQTLLGGVPNLSHVSFDGVYYAQIARNILSGDGLGWEATLFPVLQPILAAAVSYVTGITNIPFILSYISQTAGIFCLIPVYFLARELYGRKAAAAAVIITIPYPHLVAISSGDTSESLYSFLLFLSLYAGYRALSAGSRRLLFLAGLCMGLAYLARPEGMIVFGVIFLLAAWRLHTLFSLRESAKGLAVLAAGFLLFALPYMTFLSVSYGRPVFSNKLIYESMAMKNKVLGDNMRLCDIEGLTDNGEIIWREKGGAGLVLGYFTQNPGRFIRAYMGNLKSELPWEVANSSHLEGFPVVYPVYLWLSALLGFAVMFLDKHKRWVAALLWAPFINLFVYPVFTAGFWIYHVPYVPILVILAVGGALFFVEQVRRRAGVAIPLLLSFVLFWTAYTMYVRFSSAPQKNEGINIKTLISQEEMKVGSWGRENLGTDVTYMISWSRLVYYLGGRWISMPQDRQDKVEDYARRHNVDYLVEELSGDPDVLMGSRFTKSDTMEMSSMYESPAVAYRVIFWRIKKVGPPGQH